MPSEEHIRRQIEWSDTLKPYAEVRLETPIEIKGARVIPDVLIKTEGKIFLVEIGNIKDERKSALMRIFAENNPNFDFVHEPYGTDKISKVLAQLETYKRTPQYQAKYQQAKDIYTKAKRNVSIVGTVLFFSTLIGIIGFFLGAILMNNTLFYAVVLPNLLIWFCLLLLWINVSNKVVGLRSLKEWIEREEKAKRET